MADELEQAKAYLADMKLAKTLEDKDYFDPADLFTDAMAVYATEGQNIELLKRIIGDGFDPKSKLRPSWARGATLIHHVSNLEMAKFLVSENRLNVNAQDNYGDSVLHGMTVALSKENPNWEDSVKLTNFLLRFGANMGLKNNEGSTPYAEACFQDEVRGNSLPKLLFKKVRNFQFCGCLVVLVVVAVIVYLIFR